MNFFGHAMLASARDDAPGFVLGSMLPDFAGMLRARLLEVSDPATEAGIAAHHAADEAFHRAPLFVGLCARSVEALTRAGAPRGTARAVAHVGTELLLDGHLARTRDASAYLTALAAATPSGLGAALTWDDDGALRFEDLRVRLASWGTPREYLEPTFVAERLVHALASRPKLAIAEPMRPVVLAHLEHLREAVLAVADDLVASVEGALA